jgi:phosphoribosyl 1,2-cyclic phosphodiesterase
VYGILIDAGIGSRTIKKRLKGVDIPLELVQAVFITHDHVDHIKAVGSLGEKFHIPIYSTEGVHKGIDKSYGVTQELTTSKRILKVGEKVRIRDFEIEAFPVSHDSTDSVGYTVYYKGKRFTVATDLGYICENAAAHIRLANYLVLESNYDEKMLMNGHYPPHLKKRIAGDAGHLNNVDTANFLAANYHEGLEHIYLCHLSRENNTPEKAFQTVENCLTGNGIKVGEDVSLQVLSRTIPTEVFIYE